MNTLTLAIILSALLTPACGGACTGATAEPVTAPAPDCVIVAAPGCDAPGMTCTFFCKDVPPEIGAPCTLLGASDNTARPYEYACEVTP